MSKSPDNTSPTRTHSDSTESIEEAHGITRASEIVRIPGYLLDQETLQRIEDVAKDIVGNGGKIDHKYEMRSSPRTPGGHVFSCKNLDVLLPRLGSKEEPVENLSLRYSNGVSAGANIVFESDGTVRAKAFSHAPDLQFDFDRLVREISDCDQQYSWPIRFLVYKPGVRRLFRFAIILLSVFLMGTLAFYVYARRVGVNVDPSVIPPGETIANRVDEAIKSNDVNQKINVLLSAQLKGFANIRDILALQRRILAWLLIALAVTSIGLLILKYFARLYPKAFFLFGKSERTWTQLQRRREIWGGAIMIGFFINIIAGLVVGLLLK